MSDEPKENSEEAELQGAVEVVHVDDLSDLIRKKRLSESMTLQQASQIIGVSAATLSRWERRQLMKEKGENLPEPDLRVLDAITRWLGVALDRVIGVNPNTTVDLPEKNSTPEKIAIHLRADRNLRKEDAEILAEFIRTFYESRRRDKSE